MKPSRRTSVVVRALTGTAVAAVTAVALGSAPASAAYPPTVVPCHLDQTVAELNKYGDVGNKNIMVYADSAKQSAHFEGIVKQGSKQAWGCNVVHTGYTHPKTFYWVVFSGKGTFVRKGDGGYRNWAYLGVLKRTGNKVVFQAR